LVTCSVVEFRVIASMLKKQKEFELALGINCVTPGCNCREIADSILETIEEVDAYIEKEGML
jgi:hypothetical protein